MQRYYSQQGEDFVLDRLLNGQKTGFFVEVGCIDGRRFSNTLLFEERGWKGICIEAHAAYIEQLRKNRPGSIVEFCAAGDSDEEGVAFYANSRGSLSTLDRSKEEVFRRGYGEYFTGFEEQKVRMCRLDTIFDRYAVSYIDILSLDIEGSEVVAMKGLDLRRYKPRVMVIESDSRNHERELDRLILPHGYHKSSIRIGPNIFYLERALSDAKLLGKVFSISITHTAHPLDVGDDRTFGMRLDTRSRLSKWKDSLMGSKQ